MKWQAFIGRLALALIGCLALNVGYAALNHANEWPDVMYWQRIAIFGELAGAFLLMSFAFLYCPSTPPPRP